MLSVPPFRVATADERAHYEDVLYRCKTAFSRSPRRVDVAPDSRRLEEPQPSALGVHAHVLRNIAANKIGAFRAFVATLRDEVAAEGKKSR